MEQEQARVEFLRALMDCQRSLYAYVFKLFPETNEATEILQKTNLVLLGKEAEFPGVRDFGGWAARHAYFQVLAHRKTMQRERLLFDDELVHQLAQEPPQVTDHDHALRALGACLEKLSASDRDLVKNRYVGGLPIARLSEKLGRPTGSIAQSLYRIRRALSECIGRTLSAEGGT